MKPEHETRRKIIREWMSLPKDKRQTKDLSSRHQSQGGERAGQQGIRCSLAECAAQT